MSDRPNSEWKTPSKEGEGKGDGHQYGRKLRTPEPIPIAGGNSPSEEEMGHWTPTGIEPTNYDDDEEQKQHLMQVVENHRHKFGVPTKVEANKKSTKTYINC